MFGTNPIAYGVPGIDGDVHCIDMATSEAPYFEIMNAHKDGTDLREGIAVDQDGNPTINANDALDFSQPEAISNLVPMGGSYKGYYVNYLFEILTSGLIGMPSSPEMSGEFIPEEHGGLLIAFSPKALGTTNALASSIKSIHEKLENQKPKEGTKIQIPGQSNNERYQRNAEVEIEIDSESLEKLKKAIS